MVESYSDDKYLQNESFHHTSYPNQDKEHTVDISKVHQVHYFCSIKLILIIFFTSIKSPYSKYLLLVKEYSMIFVGMKDFLKMFLHFILEQSKLETFIHDISTIRGFKSAWVCK
jgi:hypothetical protein